MDFIKTIQALGFSLPTPAYFFGAVVFGLTGYTAYQWGEVSSRELPKWAGAALMLLSLVTSQTWQLYAAGSSLCAALLLFRPQPEGEDNLEPSQESD